MRHGGAAFQSDAELLAHDAGAAVATGEEVAAHRFRRAALDRAQGGGDARLVLHEILEFRAPARIDHGRLFSIGQYRVAQHGFDHDLAHPHGGLARLRAVVAQKDLGAFLDDAGIAEAVQLSAGQRSDPRDVEVVLFRHGDGAQLVQKAEPAEQLHRAAVGDVHLGMPRGRGIALDQQAAHAERGERAGERHADRPAARDQDLRLHAERGPPGPLMSAHSHAPVADLEVRAPMKLTPASRRLPSPPSSA